MNGVTATEAADGMAALARLSLQEIEGEDWGDPEPDDTDLVKNCMLLRRKPLGEFDDADLCELITQRISWPTLVPMALGGLAVDPWLDADLYIGALLVAVTRVGDKYWDEHQDQEAVLRRIVGQVIAPLDEDPGYMPWGDKDGYPGEALTGVMAVSGRYWRRHSDQFAVMRGAVARGQAAGFIDEDDWVFVDPVFALDRPGPLD